MQVTEEQIKTIIRALNEMGTDAYPPANITDRQVFDHLQGKMQYEVVGQIVHHHVIFCGDCDWVQGSGPKWCESCNDNRNHKFFMMYK